MLLEFSVTNFRSFKEKATLSLVASSKDEHSETHTIQTADHPTVLTSAVIYGPNASGKSNFLTAFDVMRDIVIGSAKKQRGDKLPAAPHLFDIASNKNPTEFEVVFVRNNVRYQYGFSFSEDRILEEWLYAFPNSRAQRWFGRVFNIEKQNYVMSFSEKLLGAKQLWKEATRENSLFLSTAVQLNSIQLSMVFDWFDNDIAFIGFQNVYPQYTASLCSSNNSKLGIVSFLQAADFDIKDIFIKESKFDVSDYPGIPDEVKSDLEKRTYFHVKTVHKVIGGADLQMDLDEESDGTKKFFGLAGPWIDILSSGKTVFVDELHDNLHPQMVNFLVGLFNDKKVNSGKAQLIFSTHDTAILDQRYLRRDQVWFVEKKRDNSSRLYPLTTFSPRKNHEDLAKNYLHGRYGALPYFKSVADAMGVHGGE